MSKWICTQEPEIILVPVDPMHFQQLLAEITKTLYTTYCQLNQDQSLPVSTDNSSSPDTCQ